MPDRARRQAVWRALSVPGAVLSDGEVVGTWRYRRADGEVAVTCFERPTARQRPPNAVRVDRAQCGLIAQVAGAEPPALRWS
ncbi:DNA glycosylase AlkZ-like family protein [Nocardia asiatica]|uniref:DNA glycosylase AlkZ-like family protein n=1 Tax=Nocardia asiatica TaxID=209252 RepID=UPI002454FA80|nr:crosslink repair DNA glycosylase YcaQ family protein [Nocardia asiatica]